MIGCLPTCVRKQPIIELYFELETSLKFYNLEAWFVPILGNGSDMYWESRQSYVFVLWEDV